MARKKKIKENITITGIAEKGQAVGRDEEGMVYFVSGAVPGDVVDVFVLRKKKSFRKAIVKEFKVHSPEKIEAFCSHFGNCGGCKWQNLDYTSQLKYKEKAIHDAFERMAQLNIQEKRPIIGCEKTTTYRNKMEYSFSSRRWVPQEELDTQEEVIFGPASGFHKAGAFDKVVQIEKCYLQEDLSNKIRNRIDELGRTNNWTFYHAREHHGFLRNAILRNSSLDEWMITISFGENQKDNITFLLDTLKEEFPELNSIYYVVNTKMNDSLNDLEITHYHGQKTIKERLGHIEYQIGPKSFFQTNTSQAERMYNEIRAIADLKGDELVYDLYTGLGSIALFLADNCRQIIGIEEIKEAIDDAKDNMTNNKISNANFEVGDVKDQFNSHFVQKYGKADLIIVDPPRAGLHKDVVDMLTQSKVSRIIYVSCNPSTQARDISLMSDKYDIELIQPIDMFPHTDHVENIALLNLK